MLQVRRSIVAMVAVCAVYAQSLDLKTKDGSYTLIDFPDATSTQVWGINARGEMVGVYVSAGVTHGFLLSGGRFQTVDYPGAALTLANNINARGDIVGEYALTPTGPHHGFLLSGGRFTTIDFPGATSSFVVGIASNGDMVGGYDSPARGFVLRGETFTKLDYPDSTTTVLGTISPQGDIVGSYAAGGVSRAFLHRNGEFVMTWEYPGAAGFTNAIGRNAAGDTVGRYRDAAAVSHGYVLSNGEFGSFDVPGSSFTGAAGITPDGDIAGRCTISGVNHGFLLKRGQQPRYKVTDLGTLGGKTATAYGIGNNGAISGWASVANGDQHPFLWRDGKMVDLGSLGGGNGAGTNPTGSMAVPLVSEVGKPDPFGADFCGYLTHRICAAAVWKDGKITALPTLGGNNAIGYAMNERGQMVGISEKATRDGKCVAPQTLGYAPVMWGPNGEMQELRLPAGDSVGYALGVNDKGEVVGATGSCENTAAVVNGLLSGKRAVLWENGVPRDLGNGEAFEDTIAIGINNRTEVVGAADLQGFLWSRDNGKEPIGAVGEDFASLPSSINNARQVVGASCDVEFNCRTFLWERGITTDLNELVGEDSPIYMVFATWINDSGEIVGWGVDKKTEEIRAFVASPVKAASGLKAATRVRTLPVGVRTRLRVEGRRSLGR